MGQSIFTVPAMPAMEFAISKMTLDALSPLNHNEAHIHKSCEVYINLSGDVSFAVENRLYPVSRGTVIITKPFEYHHCIYRSNAPHLHYWITFSAEQEPEFLMLFFNREKGMDNRLILEERELEQICAILDRLISREESSLEQRIGILQFFRILAESAPDNQAEALDSLPEDVVAAIKYINSHLSEDLDIRRLAMQSNVSVNTLERHFKDSLGSTPMETIRKRRLIASMMYLRSGSSVSESAARCGFSDYSNYIQLFRRQFGMTPGKYRRLMNERGNGTSFK